MRFDHAPVAIKRLSLFRAMAPSSSSTWALPGIWMLQPVIPALFKGTAAFAGPMTIRCEEFTAGSDVYSIGAIGYWLLTGQPPHGFGRHPEIARRMKASQIAPLPADIPDDLRQVIMESLRAPDSCAPQLAWTMQDALDPGDEPMPTTRELADLVAPFIKPTMSEYERGADYQPQAAWKSRRTITGFAAAMACLFLSAVGWRFWLDARPSPQPRKTSQPGPQAGDRGRAAAREPRRGHHLYFRRIRRGVTGATPALVVLRIVRPVLSLLAL